MLTGDSKKIEDHFREFPKEMLEYITKEYVDLAGMGLPHSGGRKSSSQVILIELAGLNLRVW